MWLGLARGPVAPAKAAELESALFEALSGYKSLHLVDAAGHALDDRPLAKDAAAVSRLLADGIDDLLKLRTTRSLEKLDKAIALFEAKLTPLRDHELLHEALMARAESQFEAGQRETAKTTLKRLAALAPRRAPSAKTHDAEFVKLFKAAQAGLGPTGKIDVSTEPTGAIIIIDGRTLGAAPLTTAPLGPGKHYVVARWPAFTVTKAVQLGAGSTMSLRLEREGPAERLRQDMLTSIERRRGAEAASKAAAKIATVAEAREVLVAGVRRAKPKGFAIYLARHDANGDVIASGRVAYTGAKRDDKNLARLTAAFFVDGREGEFEIAPSGAAQPATDVTRGLFGGRRADLDEADLPDGEAEVPVLDEDGPTEVAGIVATATPTAALMTSTATLAAIPAEPDEPVTSNWWFWAIVGVVAAGAAAGGVVALSPGASSTTINVNLPGT